MTPHWLPLAVGEEQVFTTASIGIVLGPAGYEDVEDVLRDADIGMYRAKALGKARYEMFDETMRARVLERLQLEADLRRALQREEFEVYYQPVVSLTTGEIAGFEALVRWRHPERGLISPGEFISVAEETGMIVNIDQWVLQRACMQMRAWQERFLMDPPLHISVNLSGKDFAQSDLAEQIERILDLSGLEEGNLKLEITEGVIMEDVEAAVMVLSELRTLGVQVQVDDFGTGYSSLGYLHRLPIDALKIDRSFVSGLGQDENSLRIVETIAALARGLGVDVIAEGVETEEELAELKALDCEYAQGYLFFRPMESSAVGVLLAEEVGEASLG